MMGLFITRVVFGVVALFCEVFGFWFVVWVVAVVLWFVRCGFVGYCFVLFCVLNCVFWFCLTSLVDCFFMIVSIYV